MKNLSIHLTEEEHLLIKSLSKDHRNNWQIVKRLEAIRLLDSGLTVATISEQLCVNLEVIYKYVKTYKEKGLDGLITLEKPGRESKLTEDQMIELERYIEDCRRNKIKCTTKEQVSWVKSQFGVDIGSKWLYKRLLIRKQELLDNSHSLFFWLCLIGSQFGLCPGIRRLLTTSTQIAQYLTLHHV